MFSRRNVYLALVCLWGWTPFLTGAELQAKLGVYPFPEAIAEEAGFPADSSRVYYVVEASPAGKAGVVSGDVIEQFDGRPVDRFQTLVELVRSSQPGKKVEIRVRRDGKPVTLTATLSAATGNLGPEAYHAAARYLQKLQEKHDGLELRSAIVTDLWNANRRNEALKLLEEALKKFPDDAELLARRLDYLNRTGRYSEYVAESLKLAAKFPADFDFQMHRLEALMGTGRLAEVEKASVELCAAASNTGERYAAQAANFWAISRLRQGKPLAGPGIPAAIEKAPWHWPLLDVQKYWREELGPNPPYQLETTDGPSTLDFLKEKVLLGLVPNQMHGITIFVNGVKVPLAIVDTGASHTLLSTSTAEETNTIIGSSSRRASGSLSFTARPGLVKEMRIGNLILRNVPVNVGNPPPLVMTKAKAAIGVDVMHHVRFTLDYLAGKVHVQPATAPAPKPVSPNAVWDLPLWTFSDHTLSRLKTDNGVYARALIDSGNFAQTLVWPVWASENILHHPGGTSLFVYALSNPRREIKGLSLAGRELPPWPVMDMPPVTLNDVDLLDLLMGHDLLSQYKVTIDMQARRLRLESPGDALEPPKPNNPQGLFGL